jgi:signal transduction histidine kinase
MGADTTGTDRGLPARLRRTPLLGKIVVLDLVLNVGAYVLLQLTPPAQVQAVTLVSLVVVMVLNTGLVAWALQPLQLVEEVARRVSQGQRDVRVGVMPALTDRHLARIGHTLDALLDRLDAERRQVRALAAQVVKAGDSERAHIARELHDGTAQSLTALEMLLTSAQAESSPEVLRERLATMRAIATEALVEVRTLSHTVHPRVLDDLGLAAALERLARRSGADADVEIEVACEVPPELPPALASVLYRVSQEALQNALRHAGARRITLEVHHADGWIHLRVSDDGRGFDRARPDASRHGMGLFLMEERVGLVDGHLSVDTSPGRGTHVLARLPLGDTP